jgi:hypothetical protein
MFYLRISTDNSRASSAEQAIVIIDQQHSSTNEISLKIKGTRIGDS